MGKSYQTGLIIGRFYPVHRGHVFMIAYALARTQQLTVILGSKPDEIPSGALRVSWLRELFPAVNVIHAENHNDAADHPAPWVIWAEDTLKRLGSPPDVVFSSETYGEPFAQALGCEHVLVDLPREYYPIHATQIRENPFKHWNYLPAPTRGYYAKRVAVVGAESAGKTTLAARLSQHLTTVWMPEYGREFVDRKGGIPTPDESHILTEEMLARQDALARQANRVLICDTELIVLKVLADLHFGYSPQHILDGIEQQQFDLYLLADIDIPWVGDGIHREGADVRIAQHRQFQQELEARGILYHIISGQIEERVEQTSYLIEQIIQ